VTRISHDAGQPREPARTVLAGQTVFGRSPTHRASRSSRRQQFSRLVAHVWHGRFGRRRATRGHFAVACCAETIDSQVPAAGLIRASLTGDKFATDRILTSAVEADLDGLYFAFTMANLAGRVLAYARGSEA
jgi:hypothetical protein